MPTNSKEYIRKYEAENMLQVRLTINKRTEADLVEQIKNQANKQGYIKDLIRKDMGMQDARPTLSKEDLTYLRDILTAMRAGLQATGANTEQADQMIRKLNTIAYGPSD